MGYSTSFPIEYHNSIFLIKNVKSGTYLELGLTAAPESLHEKVTVSDPVDVTLQPEGERTVRYDPDKHKEGDGLWVQTSGLRHGYDYFRQLWRLERTDPSQHPHGRYAWRICCLASGTYLDLANGDLRDGSKVQCWKHASSSNQLWSFGESIRETWIRQWAGDLDRYWFISHDIWTSDGFVSDTRELAAVSRSQYAPVTAREHDRNRIRSQQWQFVPASWKGTSLEECIRVLPGMPTIDQATSYQSDISYISVPKQLLRTIFLTWRNSERGAQRTEAEFVTYFNDEVEREIRIDYFDDNKCYQKPPRAILGSIRTRSRKELCWSLVLSPQSGRNPSQGIQLLGYNDNELSFSAINEEVDQLSIKYATRSPSTNLANFRSTEQQSNNAVAASTTGGLFGTPNHAKTGEQEIRGREDFMRNLKDFQRLLGPESANPIKVAILDTGIDLPKESELPDGYESSRYESYSWVGVPASVENPRKDQGDPDGHGTHIASIVLNIARNCKLYIVQIAGARSATHGRKANDEVTTNISRAIRYAVDAWNVDIISMSCGFIEQNRQIQTAIYHALSKEALIVAAAGNDGATRDWRWPARETNVLGMTAAQGGGDKYAGNPTPIQGSQSFSILGCAVTGYGRASQYPTATKVPQSGTSQATAVATAVAAITMQILQDCEEHIKKGSGEDAYDQTRRVLRTRTGMSAVFQHMAGPSEARDGYLFVRPWMIANGAPRDQPMRARHVAQNLVSWCGPGSPL